MNWGGGLAFWLLMEKSLAALFYNEGCVQIPKGGIKGPTNL